jgi:hypothetical protein
MKPKPIVTSLNPERLGHRLGLVVATLNLEQPSLVMWLPQRRLQMLRTQPKLRSRC